MLEYFIPLLSSFCSGQFFLRFILPIFCLAILATIPCIIREIVRIR